MTVTVGNPSVTGTHDLLYLSNMVVTMKRFFCKSNKNEFVIITKHVYSANNISVIVKKVYDNCYVPVAMRTCN